MPPFVRRFRRLAVVLVGGGVVAAVAVVVVGIVLLRRDEVVAGLTCLGLVAVMVVGAGLVASTALPRSRALAQVAAVNRDGVVFLARRQPYEVNDLATFVGGSQELLDQVSDRWVVASIDRRGLAAWSVERVSRELLLVPWSVVGAIEPVALEGDPRHGIAVDVEPFPAPLKVAVGFAAFGVLAPFRRRVVDEVIAAAEAQRP